MHEADEPNAVVDFPDAEFLTGEHGRDIDLFPVHADAAAGGDQDVASGRSPNSDRARCPGFPRRPRAAHIGDLPDEFNREAVPARADADAIDEAAKDLKRLGFRHGVNEGVLQAGDLLPIEFR